MPPAASIRVASLYRFAAFPDPAALVAPLARACASAGLKGFLLLASEGINGTLAGQPAGVEEVLQAIRALPGCAGLDVKDDHVRAMPFGVMKVRLKREIVTMGVPGLDPARDAGTCVEPADWNALIADPEVAVIDTRNAFEVAIGTFPGSIDPETASFGDFPGWFRARRAAILPAGKARVAMFCTGGIRCEKATAFLRSEGVDAVYQLKGGILRYLEVVPRQDSLWQGECFVFDERVAVGHALSPGTHSVCRACRRPVSSAERASPLYTAGVGCPACATERDAAQRRRYAERQRQMDLAAARGSAHLVGMQPAS